MATSYLTLQNGRRQEVLAATDGGSANAGLIPALDTNGKLTPAMMPNGIMPDVNTIVASEAIAAGAFVNIFSNNGTATVRNAVASAVGTEAHGYVLAAVVAGGNAAVYFDDNNSAVTGRTVGRQYLSATTPGQTTVTPPTGAGIVSQYLGFAVSATSIHSAIEPGTILAQ